MSYLPESSGTTALTNALKKVFYIHKDVVAELRAKLDTLHKENEHLKRELHKVSPRVERCESCTHLKELNRTLQENFKSRLKDKNSIIKHLEKRLRAAGACEDSTSCTEDVLHVEDEFVDNTNASIDSSITSLDSEGTQTFQATCYSKDVSGCSDDKPDENRQSTRLRLLKDGHKRSRYIEELPEAKRKKTSPIHSHHSSSANQARHSLTSLDEKSEVSTICTPSKKGLFKAEVKESNDSILVAETECSLPSKELLEHPGKFSKESADRQKENYKYEGIRDRSSTATSKNLVIPETLGIYGELESNDEDSMESILQLPTQLDEKLSKEECNSVDRFVDVNCTKKPQDVTTTPKLSESKTETTPLSPGIFDDVHRKRFEGETPRSAPPILEGEANVEVHDYDIQISPKQTCDKNDVLAQSGTYQRALRQTTLSQSFKNKSSPRMKAASSDRTKVLDEFDDGELQQASLQESFANNKGNERQTSLERSSKSIDSAAFKMPLSPAQAKALKSPKRASLKEKENYLSYDSKNSPGASNSRQGTRTSPRLAKLVTTLSEPLPSKHIENARKTLFKEKSSPVKNISRKQTREKSEIQISPTENHTNVSTEKHVKTRVLGLDKCKELSQEEKRSKEYIITSRYSNKSNNNNLMCKNAERGANQTRSSVYHKDSEISQSCGLNGSLNPDVHLSMYLESQNTHVNNSDVAPVLDLDETVAPNLVSGHGPPLKTSNLANLSEAGIINHCHGDSSDTDDNSDVEEIIGASPQQYSVLGFHSQSDSLPGTSFPCSSRSFKFTSKPRGKSLSGEMEEKEFAKKSVTKKKVHDDKKFGVTCETKHRHSNDTKSNHEKGKKGIDKSRSKMSQGDYLQNEREKIDDSFDVLPQKSEEFPHVKVVRKKSEKDKLQGFSCKLCYEYYKDLNLSEAELKYRMQVCSRHKEKYQAPATPEHFWSMSIPDTAEVRSGENHFEVPNLYKGSRRRRKLEKRFKSKKEDEENV